MSSSIPAMRDLRFAATCIAMLVAVTLGCIGSSKPPAIRPPSINPTEVATAAIKHYDENGDGRLDSQEIASAPSLRSFEKGLGGGALDAAALTDHIDRLWIQSGAGIIAIRCMVTMNGRPLDGATVTFEPEAFMGGAVKPGSATLVRGSGMVDIADEDRPHPGARGMQSGFYLIKVSLMSNGKEMIPAKYNSQTTLGCEVSARASYMPGPLELRLTARG